MAVRQYAVTISGLQAMSLSPKELVQEAAFLLRKHGVKSVTATIPLENGGLRLQGPLEVPEVVINMLYAKIKARDGISCK